MNQIPQLKTIIPMTNSIFSRMNYEFADIDADHLDILFFTDYGNRNISPLVQNVIKDINNATEDELNRLSLLVLSFYQKKWDRYKEIYTIEYDKIHNYYDELIEKVSDKDTEEIQGTNKTTLVGTNKDIATSTRTDNLSKDVNSKLIKSDTSTENNSVFGFNSSSAVNAQENEFTTGSTVTDESIVENTGTQKNDLDNTNTKNSTTDVINNSSIATSKTKERSYTHKGNIGNLTTQEILKQDIKLWEWNYIESIFYDTKDMLTLPIYLS